MILHRWRSSLIYSARKFVICCSSDPHCVVIVAESKRSRQSDKWEPSVPALAWPRSWPTSLQLALFGNKYNVILGWTNWWNRLRITSIVPLGLIVCTWDRLVAQRGVLLREAAAEQRMELVIKENVAAIIRSGWTFIALRLFLRRGVRSYVQCGCNVLAKFWRLAGCSKRLHW